ncbi:MAG: acyl-CoA dehydrogenase family protein [Burkholderiales bacterium]
MGAIPRTGGLPVLQKKVRDFIEKEVIPHEKEPLAHATQRQDALYRKLQEKARQAGIYLPQMPKALGGLGLNWRDTAVILEEAGRSLLGPRALNAAAPDEGNLHTLNHLCNADQRKRYLLPLAAGKVRSCFAMTEPAPGAGSDPSALKTKAQKKRGKWIINGKKWFITGAQGAAFCLVLAQTPSGATLFLVDTDHSGFRIKRVIGSMDSFMPGGHCEVDFVNCAVSDAAVLGEAGKGFEYAQLRLGPARLTHCMRWLGAAVRATQIATAYAGERVSFGKTLSEHQGVQFMIADSHIELHACRLLIQDAAQKLDAGVPIRHESSMVKVFVSEAVNRALDRAVQILGALGVSEDTPVSHIYRDIRAFRIYDGASEVHRHALARRIFHQCLRP